MLHGATVHDHDPVRLVDPRHLAQLMPLEEHEPTEAAGTLLLRNATAAGEDGSSGQQHRSFPWVATLLAGVLITTIVVDVIGNLLVIVSVFRNRKLRKAGRTTSENLMLDLTELAFLLISSIPEINERINIAEFYLLYWISTFSELMLNTLFSFKF